MDTQTSAIQTHTAPQTPPTPKKKWCVETIRIYLKTYILLKVGQYLSDNRIQTFSDLRL